MAATSTSTTTSSDSKVKKVEVSEFRTRLLDPTVTPRQVIMEQNRRDKELMYKVLLKEVPASQFRSLVSERLKGEWQWSSDSYNFRPSGIGCRNGCKYCYVGPLGKHFGWTVTTPNEGEKMGVDSKKVTKRWMKAKPEKRMMYFFPSTSDVFEETALDYVTVCDKIVRAGHQIFFATKPTLASATAIVGHIQNLPDGGKAIRENLYVYITIGTDDDTLKRCFEPRTSNFEERVQCVRLFAERGYHTNIIMEPYFTDPLPLLPRLLSLLPPNDGVLLIGRLNYMSGMTISNDPTEEKRLRDYLEDLYGPSKLLKVLMAVRDNPRVFLKKDTMENAVAYVKKRLL